LMTGAHLPIVNWAPDRRPKILIGKAAIMADPQTRSALQRVAKNDPVVQADAISVRRQGNRVYIAGSNDESHYFATSWLLQQWGCRWYMPTEFGEVIPRRERL